MLCSRCRWRDATRKGLCSACYLYRRRTGADRPEEAIVRHATRILTRRLEREAWPLGVPELEPRRTRSLTR